MKEIIINGCFTLGGVILGAFIPIFYNFGKIKIKVISLKSEKSFGKGINKEFIDFELLFCNKSNFIKNIIKAKIVHKKSNNYMPLQSDFALACKESKRLTVRYESFGEVADDNNFYIEYYNSKGKKKSKKLNIITLMKVNETKI